MALVPEVAALAARQQRWESNFHVSHNEVRSQPEAFIQQSFTDNDLNDLAAFLRYRRLPDFRSHLGLDSVSALPLRDLNLGKNHFGAAGLRALVGALLDNRVHLRKLWLNKCRILAGGALPVAELLEQAPGPLEELHLSHNFLDKGDVQRLLVAVARRREYPIAGQEGRKALWLRVERQQVVRMENCSDAAVESANWNMTQDMLREANAQCVIIRRQLEIIPDHVSSHTKLLCMVPWKEGGCSVAGCRFEHDYGPIVHLPYFWHQGRAFMHAGPSAPRPPEMPPEPDVTNSQVHAKVRQQSMCKNFLNGMCTWGEKCKYAHGQPEVYNVFQDGRQKPHRESRNQDKGYDGDPWGQFSKGSQRFRRARAAEEHSRTDDAILEKHPAYQDNLAYSLGNLAVSPDAAVTGQLTHAQMRKLIFGGPPQDDDVPAPTFAAAAQPLQIALESAVLLPPPASSAKESLQAGPPPLQRPGLRARKLPPRQAPVLASEMQPASIPLPPSNAPSLLLNDNFAPLELDSLDLPTVSSQGLDWTEADDDGIIEKLVAYLQASPDLAKAERAMTDPCSDLKPSVVEAAFARFDERRIPSACVEAYDGEALQEAMDGIASAPPGNVPSTSPRYALENGASQLLFERRSRARDEVSEAASSHMTDVSIRKRESRVQKLVTYLQKNKDAGRVEKAKKALFDNRSPARPDEVQEALARFEA